MIKTLAIAALLLSWPACAAESMASHESTHMGERSAAAPAERADPSDAENDPSIDPDNVLEWHDWAISTDGLEHDFGPVMKDDGSDNQDTEPQ